MFHCGGGFLRIGLVWEKKMLCWLCKVILDEIGDDKGFFFFKLREMEI